MLAPIDHFDLKTVELLGRAYRQAVCSARALDGICELTPATRVMMASRIMGLAKMGERDIERLKDSALRALVFASVRQVSRAI